MGLAALAACETDDQANVLTFNPEFGGGAIGDEPRAVLVARDMLAQGGTAADAAVAMYMTMSVTYPVAAGLGGGGLCLVYDGAGETAETLDFLPRPPAAGGPYAIPGALRGMAALHARYGRLAWAQLVGEAERFARFGVPISRALAARSAPVAAQLAADPTLAPTFTENGRLLPEGTVAEQLELATVLAAVRSNGAGAFYLGSMGRFFVRAANEIGGRMTEAELSAYEVRWRETVSYGAENFRTVHFAPFDYPGARKAAWVWRLIDQRGLAEDDGANANRSRRLRDVFGRSAGAVSSPDGGSLSARWNRPIDAGPAVAVTDVDGSTVFVTGDSNGQTVACAVGMNGAFGAARVAPGTGIVLAPNVAADRSDAANAAMAVILNPNVNETFLAVAGRGGVTGPLLVGMAAASVELEGMVPAEVLAAPRVFHPGRPNVTYVERDLPAEVRARLAEDGPVQPVQSFGIVHMLYCADGLERAPDQCVLEQDPRGLGLSTADLF